MTFGTMLSTLIIGPLKFVFEIIFQLVYELVQNPGICIIALSLVMNILVLPLYRRADAVQEEAARRVTIKMRSASWCSADSPPKRSTSTERTGRMRSLRAAIK